MKKILLSAALAVLGVFGASAQSFEVFYNTQADKNGQATGEYTLIKDGDVITVDKLHLSEPVVYPEYDMYLQNASAEAFIKISNKTGNNWVSSLPSPVPANTELSPSVSYTTEYNENVLPSGATGDFQTCVGTCFPNNPFYFDLNAHSTTNNPSDHLGYTISCNGEGVAQKVQLKAKYKFTVTYKTETLRFDLVFDAKAEDTAVDAIEAGQDALKEYYSLQGIRLAEPQKGSVCIVKQGGKVTKQVIR